MVLSKSRLRGPGQQYINLVTNSRLTKLHSFVDSIEIRLLAAGDIIFASVFVIDVGLRIILLHLKFWKNWVNYLDILVTAVSLVEIIIWLLPLDAAFFRLVRFGKLARTASKSDHSKLRSCGVQDCCALDCRSWNHNKCRYIKII